MSIESNRHKCTFFNFGVGAAAAAAVHLKLLNRPIHSNINGRELIIIIIMMMTRSVEELPVSIGEMFLQKYWINSRRYLEFNFWSECRSHLSLFSQFFNSVIE